MESLKEDLISPSVLVLPNSPGHTMLDTNTCTTLFRHVLLRQQDDGTIMSIQYLSISLTDAEKKHDPIERECLAAVRSVFFLRP